MPIIHKLEHIPVENLEITTNKPGWTQYLMKLRMEKLQKFPEQYKNRILYCICVHPESFHNAPNKVCSYNGEYCICNGFHTLLFEIKVEITEADTFEFENKEHSERDSFNWWNEFVTWKNKHKVGEN